MSAGGAAAARLPNLGGGSGSIPTPALQVKSLRVAPIPFIVAKGIFLRHHYLHSMPGGTRLTIGVFRASQFVGAAAFGAGPANAHRLVQGASRSDCLTLTRLWLEDDLPPNSESRVLGVLNRHLQTATTVKFLVTYADPKVGHNGTIYQATGWIYTGLSQPSPLLRFEDGSPRHSRSVAQVLGTRSLAHLRRNGVTVEQVGGVPKHRYVYFLDQSWRARLATEPLPYPKRGAA